MDAFVKRQLIGMMKSHDHGHESMTETSLCNSCGTKFQKAKAWYERMQRTNPELFVYTPPVVPDSERLNEMKNQLEDRLKKDPLYQEHIRKTFYGTEEEKKIESQRANSGYYKTHAK